LLFSARVIPYRGSWLDFEFDPKDLVYCRIDRRRNIPATILLSALAYETQEILDIFFDTNAYKINKKGVALTLIPDRLRGETATFDIKDKKGKVIVENERRITARHIREMEKVGLKELMVPAEYLIEQVLAKDIVDMETGELLTPANTEITEELLEQLLAYKELTIETLYTNDLDRGPYIADTLRIDTSTTPLEAQVEIYRMMRPGEPPTKDSAENLFKNLFFSPDRYDLSAVGRMKFNRRIARKEIVGEGILSKEDITEVLKLLIDIKNGKGTVDDIEHLDNRRIRRVGEMAENQFTIGMVLVERAVNERIVLADSEGLLPK